MSVGGKTLRRFCPLHVPLFVPYKVIPVTSMFIHLSSYQAYSPFHPPSCFIVTVHPSTHVPINTLIHPPFHRSHIHQPIHLSIYPSIRPYAYPSDDGLIRQSSHPFICLSIHPLICPSTQPFIMSFHSPFHLCASQPSHP